VRQANLVRFCGDDASRLRPTFVQTGREDGGQNLKIWQICPRAEAPRQRRKEREPRPELVRRSYWIWLRTGSVYGIPVTPILTHVWLMCETDGAKGFLFGQKVSVTTYRRSECNCVQLRTPSGEQIQPKSRKGNARNLGELAHPYQSNLSADGTEVRGVIVVRGRENRLHGEGHQPVLKESLRRRRPTVIVGTCDMQDTPDANQTLLLEKSLFSFPMARNRGRAG
jgi:hypothetical protein